MFLSPGEQVSVKNLLHDMKQGHVSMTDESAFEVGRNVATTEGQVVFENDLFQLIGVHLTEAQQGAAGAAFRMRFPWLLANIAGGIAAAAYLLARAYMQQVRWRLIPGVF